MTVWNIWQWCSSKSFGSIIDLDTKVQIRIWRHILTEHGVSPINQTQILIIIWEIYGKLCKIEWHNPLYQNLMIIWKGLITIPTMKSTWYSTTSRHSYYISKHFETFFYIVSHRKHFGMRIWIALVMREI